MNIYLAASITHASEEFKKSIEEFRSKLKQKYQVLDFLGLVKGNPKEVYQHDTQCVKDCDLVIAECSYPSTGLGFEIALALSLNKPVVAVAQNDAKVSRLILGIQHPQYKFKRFNSLDEILDLIPEYSTVLRQIKTV